MQGARDNEGLVELVRLAARGYLDGEARGGAVLDAMRAIDRAAFLPPECRDEAYLDEALPIGAGQTCSQPSMVAFMLDKLRLFPGARLLEVGAGSGYAAAVAALLVGREGLVVAAEIEPGLAALGRANCLAAGGRRGLPDLAERIEFVAADGSEGLPDREPFDRILLSAGVGPGGTFREERLLARLKPGGILIYPEARGMIHRLTRSGGRILRESWGTVSFVPLRGRNA